MHSKREPDQPRPSVPRPDGAKTGAARDGNAKPAAIDNDGVQGERQLRCRTRGSTKPNANSSRPARWTRRRAAAAPKTDAERQEMVAAEQEGKRRAKGEAAPPTRKEDK